MRQTLLTLALGVAMAIAASVSLAPVANAQHRGHHYGRGFGHFGYGHGLGFGYRGGLGFGYRGYGPYGYRGYSPYGYGGYGRYGYGGLDGSRGLRSTSGAVRIEVNPKDFRDDAQVYVNGANVGVVDDFDGRSQRLYLPSGTYEIEVRRDGYRTLQVQAYVAPGTTHRIRHRMEPLAAE